MLALVVCEKFRFPPQYLLWISRQPLPPVGEHTEPFFARKVVRKKLAATTIAATAAAPTRNYSLVRALSQTKVLPDWGMAM